VDSDQWENVRKTLRVICEEAFRCKEIVGKLLSLARPGEENRARIPLAEVARGVVGMVGALKEYRGRRVEVHVDPGERLDVLASEGDMKQVVLNLVINALEAEGSVVRVDVGRVEGMVQLAVSDNGRGMSGEVVERVFEPFFTGKRGTGQRGVGLGLSITHAIVASHGGSIRAESEGVGKGSRFVVRLPAAEGGEV
jgi:signal transduction histidine kinase